MDVKDLNKKQMILLTLLITFVVSIATGIVTVSLMNQAPKAIPQTINNVIQRTIEKVTTVTTPASPESISQDVSSDNNTGSKSEALTLMEGNVLVSIYPADYVSSSSFNVTDSTISENRDNTEDKSLGQGIIISDIGLILVDSNILNNDGKYIVVLDETDFDATVIKKFNNGFSILKISEKKVEVKIPDGKEDASNTSVNN